MSTPNQTPSLEDILQQPRAATPPSAPQAPKPGPKIEPFNDIARRFDPMMSQQDYDQRRTQYFNQYMKPWYQQHKPDEAGKAWETFKGQTERRPLLSAADKILIPGTVWAQEFIKDAEESAPVKFLATHTGKFMAEDYKKTVTADQARVDWARKVMAREGLQVREAAGEMAGQLGEMAFETYAMGSVGKGLGAVGEGLNLLQKGSQTAKAIGLYNKFARGGVTFGLYGANHDEKGFTSAFTHPFSDGSFYRGFTEGVLFNWAGKGGVLKRVFKGGMIGSLTGAWETKNDEDRGLGAFIGGVMGAAFGLIPGEPTKEELLKKALTREGSGRQVSIREQLQNRNPPPGPPGPPPPPGGGPALDPNVDAALAQSTVDSSAKAVRNLKPPEITRVPNGQLAQPIIGAQGRFPEVGAPYGVRSTIVGPDGQPFTVVVRPHAEHAAAYEVQNAIMNGGQHARIEYSDTHGDTLNRYLRTLNDLGSGNPEVLAKMREDAAVQGTVVNRPDGRPNIDGLFDTVAEHDTAVRAYGTLSESTALSQEAKAALRMRDAAKAGRAQTGRLLAENFLQAANRFGQSGAERKFINGELVKLYNQRNTPVSDPVVWKSLEKLAYQPDLKSFIPRQFRDSFDKAILTSPPGTRYETTHFPFMRQFAKLEPLSPMRTTEEITRTSELLAKIEAGPPPRDPARPELAVAQKDAYEKALQQSYSYPEVGKALPDARRTEWEADRKKFIQRDLAAKAEAQKQALKPTKPMKGTVVVNGKTELDLKEIARMKAEWKSDAEEKIRLERLAQERMDREKFGLTGTEEEPPEGHGIMTEEDVDHNDILDVMRDEIEGPFRHIEGGERGVRQREIAAEQSEFEQRVQKTLAQRYPRRYSGNILDKARELFQNMLGHTVPPAETNQLKWGENIREEDGVLKVYVPEHIMKQWPGVGAFYEAGNIHDVLVHALGFDRASIPQEVYDYIFRGDPIVDPDTGRLQAGRGSGIIVQPAENPVQHEFHELTHHDMAHAWGMVSGLHPEELGLAPNLAQTMSDIAGALTNLDAYKGLVHAPLLNEEAFVHAATAVMKGDSPRLAAMGLVDVDAEHVIRMVNEVASKTLQKLHLRPDWMELRYTKDRLENIRATSSPYTAAELREAADRIGSKFYSDDTGLLHLQDTEGVDHSFKTKAEAFQWMQLNNASAEAPSFTTALEHMGLVTDDPMWKNFRFSPSDKPVIEQSADLEPSTGILGLSHWLRPTAQWFGSLQNKLNAAYDLTEKGLAGHLDILGAFKGVDDANRNVSNWADDQRKVVYNMLKQFPKEALFDVYDFVSTDERFWPQMAKQRGVDQEYLDNIKPIHSWLKQVDAEHHLGIFNYFQREMPLLKLHGFNFRDAYPPVDDPRKASTFYRGMLEERFDPGDGHIGRFLNYVMGAVHDKAMVKPIDDLMKVANTKDKTGNFILGGARDQIKRYSDYMEGKGGFTQRVINQATEGFQTRLAEQFKKINSTVGYKLLPEEFDYPRANMNKLMILSYASGLVGRPAVALRDSMQVLMTSMPVIGMGNFSRGLAKLFEGGGLERAQQAGATLRAHNVGELYGDLMGEIPVGGRGRLDKATQLSSKLLSPSRWGHNFGRAITYLGTEGATLDAIPKLRRGEMTPDKFMAKTGIWFMAPSERDRYIGMILDKSVGGVYQHNGADLAKQISLDMVDRTQWAFRRGSQPGMLRTGAGRIFGQYATWPANYIEYIRTLGARALEGGPVRKQALMAAGSWIAVNTAAMYTMENAGIDPKKWLFLSPAGYGGSPQLELVQNLLKAPEESKEGLDARKQLLQYPINFVPGGNALRQSMEVLTDDKGKYWDSGGPTGAGWWKLLGFRPLDEKLEQKQSQWDPQQRMRYELGLRPGKGDLFGQQK